jgi:hypothetical protein
LSANMIGQIMMHSGPWMQSQAQYRTWERFIRRKSAR